MIEKKIFVVINMFISFLVIFLFGINSSYGADEPPSSLKLIIPEYKVNKIANIDYVEIPGGEILLREEGRPRIPCYIKSINYPKGYRIQNVILKERSGLKTATGLKLPAVILSPHPRLPIGMKEGWYPEKDYNWKVWENTDGSTTLIISIYPFYYNPKTTEIKFYKNYKFDIDYVFTHLSIVSLTTDKDIYNPGDNVKINVKLKNEGKPQDVTLTSMVKKGFSEKVIYSLPEKSLKNLTGIDSLSLEWGTKDFPTGDYLIEINLKDKSGNILDKENTIFRLGNPLGKITGFSVAPKHFQIGDKIKLSLKFKNVGSCKISGNCVFKIREAKKIIKESSYEFTNLKAGDSLHFEDIWDTKKAKKGAIYYILGYVRYEGTATPAEYAVVSTNLFPIAKFNYSPEKPAVNEEITFDASSSTDTDGKIVEFRWQFGDGRTAKGKIVTHRYSLPGDYKVTLIVTDNEDATGITTVTVSIGK